MPVQLNPAEQRAIDTISRVGWMVMKVSPNEEDTEPRWFAYTVGLSVTFGWPEIICFGLGLDVAGELLNNAVGELRAKKIRPAAGVEFTDVIDQRRVRLRTFSSSHYRDHLGWAIWFADREGVKPAQFSCLQLLWPDKFGRFPGDPECDPGVAAAQSSSATH